MGEIVVFGAGGRAGRAAVAEARGRGHHVTAVVRDPAKYGDLGAEGVRVVPAMSPTRPVSPRSPPVTTPRSAPCTTRAPTRMTFSSARPGPWSTGWPRPGWAG